jgi:hypothetical protein
MDATLGLGVSLGVGDSEFSIGGSLGADFTIERNSTQIVESISLTYKEADNVNEKSSGNTCWGLTNKTAEVNDDGFFEANVTIDVGKDKITTDEKVYSSDGKVWMSSNYRAEARKAEEEDRK